MRSFVLSGNIQFGMSICMAGLCAAGLAAFTAQAQKVTSDYIASDNGDGTFTNPVVAADYPDPDVIRVGDDYYMVSSDFHSVPGDPILHSKDLVNWQVVSHSIPLYDSDPRYDMEGGTRYGLGSWAPSLRYHDGTFYVLYNTNDHGAYIARSVSASGPWTLNALGAVLYDPGLFFDDDGRVWVISGQTDLSLTELTADLRGVKTPTKVIYKGQGQHYDEGSHVYKRNGYYYIVTATTRHDLPEKYALQTERSRSLSGPYETKVIFTDDANWKSEGLHQGGFVQTQKGDWWAIIFQGRFTFGREPTLQPVHWFEDWPVVGVDGRAVITYTKPDIAGSFAHEQMTRSDEFHKPVLGLQWEWNHNPDDSKWTLTERTGFLRLKTATVTQDWQTARNTLWQRLVEGGDVTVTAKLDVSGMRDGDVAGLGMFQLGTSSIGVTEERGHRIVIRNQNKIVAQRQALLRQPMVWLRLQIPAYAAETHYSYSLDGRHFTLLGDAQPMQFRLSSVWIGERISLFNYATKVLGGHIDVGSFLYDTPKRTNLFQAEELINAQRYDEINRGHVQWIHDPSANQGAVKIGGSTRMAVGSFGDGGWVKFNRVHFAKRAAMVRMNVVAASETKIEFHLDSPDGELLGRCGMSDTGGGGQYQTQICPVTSPLGTRALYLVFQRGGDAAAAIQWFTFVPAR